jgi:sugar diacid utilization regulator
MDGTSSSAVRPDRSSAEPSGPTLDAVVGPLVPLVLEVVAVPRGLGAPVGDVVIRDPLGGADIHENDIVLAVGVAAVDSRQMLEVLREAGVRAATAIIVKADADVGPELLDSATAQGVAVLTTPPETSWAQLHSLLRTAIDTTGKVLRSAHDDSQVGDLFSLANAVAAMVGGPVTIEDPQSRVLAYSNLGHETDEARRQTILGRRIPDEWMERLREEGFFARLWSSEDVVQYDAGDNQTRLVIAVKGGGEILGSIWVADGGTPFQPSARDAMREAASMAALHMVRHRAAEDLERRTRGELLRSLLEGRGSVEAAASRLELDADTGAAVLAFELNARDEPDAVLKGERVAELVMTYCRAFRRRVAQTTIDQTLYVLLPVTGAGEHGESARRLAQEIIDTAGSALSADLRAAIGSTVSVLQDIPRSRSEADRVLAVLDKYDLGLRVTHVNDVHSHAAVLELKDLLAERPHLWSPKLDLLIECDAQRATAHVPTLRAYLDCLGDVRLAAQQVHVHPNTFRYRLRRLVELSGLDLDDPDERLVVELQLRLL